MSIRIRNVSKTFGGIGAVKDVSLDVPNGTLMALLGPSGSGKTTLLRIIAGLEVADRGTILHHDEDVTEYSARDRRVGFVFQHYALFRHMTIADNIGYGLRVRGVSKAERQARVSELLKLIRLEGYGGRYPSQLSGGQRQRVALARALAARPKVLLLDEPFGALDAKVRQELRQWIRRLHDEIHVTSIFVTHDQEEAFEVADHVVIMNEGRIEQVGTPHEVYSNPATPFVYQFIGDVNVFHGRLDQGHLQLGPIRLPVAAGSGDGHATVGVRPHQLTLEAPRGDAGGFRATVVHVNAAGGVVKVQLLAPWGDTVRVEVPRERYRELRLERHSEVFVRVETGSLYLAPSPTRP